MSVLPLGGDSDTPQPPSAALGPQAEPETQTAPK
jgi:hypothetical protein